MASLIADFVKDALPELFVESQVVKAEQAFARSLKEYEMNIEQQKLFREDLRDLVELTVGRMDIYHLVGALLLEFTITFYCENRILEKVGEEDTPRFVAVFFLIHNVSAMGFLVNAVWLSMHASVAAHSVGVRLLTRFARLSVPSRKELDEVASVRLAPLMDRLKKTGKRLGFHDQEEDASEEPVIQPGSAVALAEGAITQSDREYHFRRFLREQRRWLLYDAYARVCMALGINQVIAALSYYVIGAIAEASPVGAALTMLGLQVVSFQLFRLDLAEGFYQTRGMLTFVVTFQCLPPLYVSIMVTIIRNLPSFWHRHLSDEEILSVPAFLFLATFMLAVAYVLGSGHGVDLPKQLRTVLYLDVLNIDQDSVTQRHAAQEAIDQGGSLEASRLALQQAMRDVLTNEATSGSVSVERRKTPELATLEAKLHDSLAHAKSLPQSAALRSEIRRSEKALDHFSVWQGAPEIHAMLSALNSNEVAAWMNTEQKESISRAYKCFLQKCSELDMGIGKSSGEGQAAISSMEVAEVDTFAVRVEVPEDMQGGDLGYSTTSSSVIVDPHGNIEHDQPTSQQRRTTSITSALGSTLPLWTQQAMRLRGQPTVAAEPVADLRVPMLETPGPRGSLRNLRRASIGRLTEEVPILPETATPPEKLPGYTVRRFSFAMALLWIIAAVIFTLQWIYEVSHFNDSKLNDPTVILTFWPSPATYFQVDIMQCNGKSLFVGNRFGAFKGEFFDSNVSNFLEIAEGSAQAVICNEDTGCAALSSYDQGIDNLQPSRAGSSRLRALSGDLELSHLPVSWKRVAGHSVSSHVMNLAGWDGSEVFLSVARKQANSSDWKSKLRFSLHPPRGAMCAGHEQQSSFQKKLAVFAGTTLQCSRQWNYENLKAIQFGAAGRFLAVLFGSGRRHYLDAWDLEGIFLGRWQLPGIEEATALCFKEGQRLQPEILVSRQQQASAPTIESFAMPVSLWTVLRGHGSNGSANVLEL